MALVQRRKVSNFKPSDDVAADVEDFPLQPQLVRKHDRTFSLYFLPLLFSRASEDGNVYQEVS